MVIVEAAESNPQDLNAQIEAAYYLDREGCEDEALVFYERAWFLGVPPDQQEKFMVCYGSTLRNCGKHTAAVEILSEASSRFPDSSAVKAFLALALHSSGRSSAAVAAAIEGILVSEQRSKDVPTFSRALSEYVAQLRDRN